MARFFSNFPSPVASSGESHLLQNLVGESVSKIDSLVPSVVKEVSSEAVSAIQNAPGVVGNVATGVQGAGVVGTAGGFIKQISSDAVSAAQGVATEIQHVGLPVSSEAISAAQKASGVAGGVATEVHNAGLLSTASGFIKQVSSDAVSAAQGVATGVQHAGVVGQSLTNIDRLVPSVIKQVSSDAISAVQNAPGAAIGMATDLQSGGVLNTASGFIKQVSSDAISAAQGVAAEVQHAGAVGESLTKIDNLVPQVIKQVSSEAISAAQNLAGVAAGVAADVQHGGVLGTASGFIKDVSSKAISAAQGVATELGHGGTVKEEAQKLKYLAFVQVAVVHLVLCFTNLYAYVKERLGPLKLVVEIVERIVKSVLQPVFDKYVDVLSEHLKFADDKVGEFVTKIDGLVPSVVKQVLSKVISAAGKALGLTVDEPTKVQSTGVVSSASGFLKQVTSGAISAAEGVPVGAQSTGVLSSATGFLQQVSSGAISAAEGVPIGAQSTGVLSSASGFLQQVSSGAISAAEGVASEVQKSGLIPDELQSLKYVKYLKYLKYLAYMQAALLRAAKFYIHIKESLGPLKPVIAILERVVKRLYRLLLEPLLKRLIRMVFEYFGIPVELLDLLDKLGDSATNINALLPSGALSAVQNLSGVAAGLATEVPGTGLVGTASGFIKQISSDAVSAAQGAATGIPQAGLVGQSLTKIDSLIPPVFGQVSSGAISAAQKVASGGAIEVQPGFMSSATGFIKQISSNAITVAQNAPVAALVLATEVQPAGVGSTATGFIKQLSSQAVSAAQKSPEVAPEVQHPGVVSALANSVFNKIEPKVERCAVSVWHKLNKLPLFPQVASVVVPTAAFFTDKYNQTVVSSAEKGYKVASFLPLVPTAKIAKVFGEAKPESQLLTLSKRLLA